jgi:hypothetical protein
MQRAAKTGKLNAGKPQASRDDVPGGIADHPIKRMTDLLPCRFALSQRSAILAA